MGTEVWFRNPHNYVRELVECGEYNIAWDRGMLIKRQIDPVKHAELYYGEVYPYRLLIIGEQGTVELRKGFSLRKPAAVYPTWTFGDELSELEDMLAYPAGESEEICSTPNVAPDELPVFGQEHRVVLTGMPNGQLSTTRALYRKLKELQEDYPKAILHLHGSYSWNVAFGQGFKSADVDPRFSAQKGKVILPNGSIVPYEKTFTKGDWTKLVGFTPSELSVPRNRCMYNIKSAVWASEHFEELFSYRTRKSASDVTDTTSSDVAYIPSTSKTIIKVGAVPQEGDKYICNTCSLFDACKFAREGAVCSVPGSEPLPLAKYFSTRDSEQILDGLAILMKSNVRRYERGLQDEAVNMELLPEVTRIQSTLFEQGVKLAKLINPALRSGPKIGIQVGGGSAVQINNGSPRQAIKSAVRELEAQGIPREQITPEMIQGIFESMNKPELVHRVIEGEVSDA